MKLRKLEAKDAPFMLEWMHDEDVVRYMRRDFMSMTLKDCLSFIESAQDTTKDLHFAVVDDHDEYLGTVSLKHIHNGRAEFGITMRRGAMGTGISRSAMDSLIEFGFDRVGLREIYWCVEPDNIRAVRFYDKNGYTRSSGAVKDSDYTEEEKQRYIWYKVSRATEAENDKEY